MEEYWSNPRKWFIGDHWQRMGRSFRLWKRSDLNIAGAAFRCPTFENEGVRPVVLGAGMGEFSVKIQRRCRRLHVLGHVVMPEGYPVVGAGGDVVARYRLTESGGQAQEIPLRNGFEVVQANTIQLATRINPVATEAQRALRFVRFEAREQYQFLLYTIDTGGREIDTLSCVHQAGQSPLMILAVTAELA
jgi:hypothetical protein